MEGASCSERPKKVRYDKEVFRSDATNIWFLGLKKGTVMD